MGLQAPPPWPCSLFLSLGFHQPPPLGGILLASSLLHRAAWNSLLQPAALAQAPGAAEKSCLQLLEKSSHLAPPPKSQKREPYFLLDIVPPPLDIPRTPSAHTLAYL